MLIILVVVQIQHVKNRRGMRGAESQPFKHQKTFERKVLSTSNKQLKDEERKASLMQV
jgi:hypothetical protein